MSPMAALAHSPHFGSSFTSHKSFSFPLHHFSETFVCSQRRYYPSISSRSATKTRASRKVKSNTELCSDIREFISTVGFREGHVPSLKELSQHGRQDLANIVRRRGYKLINHLLSTSIEYEENASTKKEGLTELHDAGSKGQCESIGQKQKLEDVNKNLSDEVCIQQIHLESASGDNNETNFGFDGSSNIALKSSLQDKVTNFIKSGELDTFEDDFEDLPKDSNSSVEKHFERAFGRSNMGETLNGSISLSKEAMLNTLENDTPRDGYLPNGELATADYDEESDVETRKRGNESEVDRLKFMLHQREMELSELKDQIEKEKLALSVLQTEAEKEISKAQKLIADYDTELREAEELISDLKEVQVQYMGDGETVQVAGSFNGWHQPITMDPQPPSSIMDPSKSRNSRLWSTVLWLYPGTYEIKFVIDGDWRIDPQRETVTMGTIQNNILRVGR